MQKIYMIKDERVIAVAESRFKTALMHLWYLVVVDNFYT